jgi:hypothetical protein
VKNNGNISKQKTYRQNNKGNGSKSQKMKINNHRSYISGLISIPLK